MTIIDAIKEVLNSEGRPLTCKEIYKKIVEKRLYVFGAKNPEGVVNGQIRSHCKGIDFPSASPVKHFVLVSRTGRSAEYTIYDEKNKVESYEEDKNATHNELLPEEKIQQAYLEQRQSIKQLLLDEILKSPPAFFERLVVDLLLAMGYGGDFPNAGIVKGGVGDAGIDGVIKEDRLGLDRIYIQAKRYACEHTIGRPDLQQFVGAMENVQKGVFITTSDFSGTAIKYAESQQKHLALINGDMLCDLMLNHGIGVSPIKSYTTYKVDMDYFRDL